MSTHTLEKSRKAILRKHRTRARISGTAERPRLSVKRSSKHIYVQLIDDVAGRTLVSASDVTLKAKGKPMDVAREVGKAIAERAKSSGIQVVVFDRGAYRYHGRIAALADSAREAGLKI